MHWPENRKSLKYHKLSSNNIPTCNHLLLNDVYYSKYKKHWWEDKHFTCTTGICTTGMFTDFVTGYTNCLAILAKYNGKPKLIVEYNRYVEHADKKHRLSMLKRMDWIKTYPAVFMRFIDCAEVYMNLGGNANNFMMRLSKTSHSKTTFNVHFFGSEAYIRKNPDHADMVHILHILMCAQSKDTDLYRLPGSTNGSQLMGIILEYIHGAKRVRYYKPL